VGLERVAVTADLTNKTIGNYKLLRLLGEGGMGVVYEAEHTAMGRRAAVKMLRAESARDEQTIRRFFNEARATNEVKHPGIVQIYDCGTAADGAPWLIMELLEGETLGARLARRGALPPEEAAGLGAQAASVLAAAHKAGIVHRDLKPDNLFVVPDPNMPSGERVKVLDFGIAKLAARGDAGGNQLRTQTGMLMGTPLYMSPEQCRGTKQVDFRSDIYSLGLMIYQMLAGEPPFVSEGIGELFHMHMNVRQQPLSERVPSLPAGLSTVVDKALEKDPADRFADMGALQAALLAALKTAPAPAPVQASGGNVQQTGGATNPRVTTTTLSASAGEAGDLDELAPARRRSRAPLAVAALLVLGVGGVLGARALRPGAVVTAPALPAPQPEPVVHEVVTPPPKAEPETPPKPVEPARVAVDIATTPARARLVDAADGRLLGVTPFHDLLPRREGALELRLEKKGYEPRTISVPLDRKFDGAFELKRAASGGGDSSGERIIKL
jgi:serine/threonine-protein kinase